jgi:hypothetical protein
MAQKYNGIAPTELICNNQTRLHRQYPTTVETVVYISFDPSDEKCIRETNVKRSRNEQSSSSEGLKDT